jgi:hypothetical protein
MPTLCRPFGVGTELAPYFTYQKNDGTALGKIEVEAGDVLFLALEDGPRRLQRRLKTILEKQGGPIPPTLSLATTWARSGRGGLEAIDAWLTADPNIGLVVIDTLARIRDKRKNQSSIYEEDYDALAFLKDLADKHGVAILIIHHTNKGKAEGAFDAVSGSLGLTGAADAALVLRRSRHSSEATLDTTGRDIDEQELHLRWEAAHCLWSPIDAPDDGLTPDQRKVILFDETVLGNSLNQLGCRRGGRSPTRRMVRSPASACRAGEAEGIPAGPEVGETAREEMKATSLPSASNLSTPIQ